MHMTRLLICSCALTAMGCAQMEGEAAPAAPVAQVAPAQTAPPPPPPEPTPPPAMKADILTTAQDAGQFSILLKAVDAAGLKATLQGAGPFTLLAPTDAAFAALPAGQLDTLLKPENKAKLTALLTAHVAPGALSAKDLAAGPVKSLQGQALTGALTGATLKVNGATVIAPNLEASNGVIHVIDKVLAPAAK